MKALFMGNLLFCIIVFNACGGKKIKVDGREEPVKEAIQKEFSEKCKAVKLIDTSMRNYADCMIKVYKEPSPTTTKYQVCNDSVLKDVNRVKEGYNQRKISLEFFTNLLESMRKTELEKCFSLADTDKVKGLSESECMDRNWNQTYQGLKNQYSCD